MCASHTLHSNAAIGNNMLCFTVKARLQVSPTKYKRALWYPDNYQAHRLMHRGSDHHTVSVAHIMNGCEADTGLHTACHDHIVGLIVTAVSDVIPREVSVHTHSRVMADWFDCSHDVTSLTPKRRLKQSIYMDIAFSDNLNKHQPSVANV